MSDLPLAASGNTAASAQIGAELRARRESLGWKLPDLARSLRIRETYLSAIEAGRIGELPGTTYALGFVRAYASALGLPGEQVASRFRAESAEAAARPALSFPVPVPRRGAPAGALMLAGLLILAGAYAGWFYVTEHQRTPAETVPPIPDRLAPHATEKPAPSPQVASILPSASAPTAAPPVSAPAPSAPAPATTNPPAAAQTRPANTQAALPPVAAPTPQAPQTPAGGPATAPLPAVQGPPRAPGAAVPGAAAPAPSQTAQPISPPPVAAPPGQPTITASSGATGHTLLIRATAPAWVTVKPKTGGAAVFNKLMHPGDSWPVPLGQTASSLLLTTGNAGGTEIVVDGAPTVSLGPPGTVFRDLPLDPDMLKSGHLPPSRPPHAKPAPRTDTGDAQ